jgi:hypothetical protein
VRVMCAASSGYAWRSRPQSPRKIANRGLLDEYLAGFMLATGDDPARHEFMPNCVRPSAGRIEGVTHDSIRARGPAIECVRPAAIIPYRSCRTCWLRDLWLTVQPGLVGSLHARRVHYHRTHHGASAVSPGSRSHPSLLCGWPPARKVEVVIRVRSLALMCAASSSGSATAGRGRPSWRRSWAWRPVSAVHRRPFVTGGC